MIDTHGQSTTVTRWRARAAWRQRGIMLVLMLWACLGYAQGLPNPFPPESLSVTTLPNGVRLITREDHSMPLVAMAVVVHGGSSAPGGGRGVAHYTEHLVWQATTRYPTPMGPQHALELAGGVSNASTSRDMTCFTAAIPTASVETMVRVLADVVLNPLLRESDFADERQLVLAEIQRDGDDPVTAVLNGAYHLSYGEHPYRERASGTITDVLSMTVQQVRAYHARWFVPGNISIVLVGDLTPARAMSLVSEAFSAAPAPAPSIPAHPDRIGDKMRVHFTLSIGATYHALAFVGPSGTEETAVAAMDVLTALLVDSPDALLPARWARDGVICDRYGIEYVTLRNPGRLVLWGVTTPDMATRWRDATRTAMAEIAAHGVSEDVLDAAKGRLAAQFLLANETYTQQASTLAFYENLGGAAQLSRYLAAVRSVTSADLRQAAAGRVVGWVTIGQVPEGE